MNRPETAAFEATKEIVTATVSNSTLSPIKANGEKVGEYFQAIYNKILEITKDIQY